MNTKMIMALTAVIMILAVSTTSLAFAQTEEEDLKAIAADAISATITISGTGAGAGALLSILRVAGKRMDFINKHSKTGKPEPFIFAKFILTVLIGGGIGAVLGFAGIPAEAAIGLDFIVVYFVSQIITPLFSERAWKNPK